MNRKTMKRVLIIATVLLLAVVIYIPTKAMITSNAECKEEQESLRIRHQAEIEELNKVEIFSGTKPVDAQVIVHGCSKSLNQLGIVIKKEYDGQRSADSALNMVRAEMSEAGYAITSENFGSEGCKAIYRVEASKGESGLYVALSQKEFRISDCTDDYPRAITEDIFKRQTIDSALVSPICGEDPCL